MAVSDQNRVEASRNSPQILELWFALQPLKSVLSFMNTGAHPDDETTAMLAALAFDEGMQISFACANRGEGGQNDIGTESTEILGTLRTAEMERAADVLAMNLYWLSEDPSDSIFDFGFSKSGVESLEKWGRERTLKRFVEIIRQEKPDMICPTFLDVPGQHGHHRAMTELAHEVVTVAADPAYKTGNLPPWQIKKLYLPAWSGAGQAYDDDLPPPPETMRIAASGSDPMTGWSWALIGEHSRVFHKTQGMGRWVDYGSERDWPLHLAASTLAGTDTAVGDGLPTTVGEISDYYGVSELRPSLDTAQIQISRALESFPNYGEVLSAAQAAYTAIDQAIAICPDQVKAEVMHRLERKSMQLANVIRIAAGVKVRVWVDNHYLHAGASTNYRADIKSGIADAVDFNLLLPDGWRSNSESISLSADATPSGPYPAIHLPLQNARPAVEVNVTHSGQTSRTIVPFETTPVALPANSGALSPDRLLVNKAALPATLSVTVSDLSGSADRASLAVPAGWQAVKTGRQFDVSLPSDTTAGTYELAFVSGSEQVQTVTKLQYPHTAPRAIAAPASVKICVLDVAVPTGRIGYVGGGNDNVSHWLRAMGCDVEDLADEALAETEILSGFSAIVIGIFALRTRPALTPALPALHSWVEDGGSLITLYHRPWDNWDPASTPIRPLEIGQPSLRWRATDENADVTYLVPDHPLLSTPNAIGPADWENWHKERGLYFAKSWDPAYVPLLSMADPDEAPQLGSLLCADVGKGRHIHTSLILHHQMEKLIPGAFRIMANLLTPRT